MLDFLKKFSLLFTKGGLLSWFYPLYEGTFTFLYSSGRVTTGRTHVRDFSDLKRIMIIVWAAVFPAMFYGWYNIGNQTIMAIASLPNAQEIATTSYSLLSGDWHYALAQLLGASLGSDAGIYSMMVIGAVYFLPIYIVVFAVGGFWEVLFCIVHHKEINEGFFVTSIVFALVVPATMPLWQAALGISFGVVIGKEVFGGTGRNFVNPALCGRAFLFFAYPASISGTNCWVPVDGFSGATPLAQWAEGGLSALKDTAGNTINWMDAFIGNIPGSIGEGSTLMILVGALIILTTGVASLRIMVGILIGAFLTATLFNYIGSETNNMFSMPFEWHAVLGGFAFGTVFMATDPVSSSFTSKGKWAFGILIGVMVILIRTVNPAYPEGMMLAILFANCFAPLFDYLATKRNIKRRLARVQA
ncbi:MAG: NADH:ubiquinone reductase (Na(+)-transporting) subunit B [Succinivibrio sp.]|nr:NADH:ubiquinone reductase (Na(+)-transporting) subunit B [Succinivibrio sp.]MCI5576448.1 NADH:ubiquinone reductase (Na(+)-transporting) subunit B [Succinivibrio sp.]MCI5639139.1 NADH:ubiquinone reductase (Na(+)-transporting) subunit B [Succinivibrio sp.]MCI7773334.1 NADH:ubiquinone reductase (Na(+)-transporting) subunit B [Succinivibrio sp.]MCI7785276.1 NADH:ubiquinone reductase (Na(+)-transporting) subunit B [Succinivibrio sp.]